MIKYGKVNNQYIDGRNLLSYLHIHDVIDLDEKENLYELDLTECTQDVIKVLLKLRKDEDMIRFLHSLQCAKYNDVFCWLTEKLKNTRLTNKHQCVQIIDENTNTHQFIWFNGSNPSVNFVECKVQLKELHNTMLQSRREVGVDAKKIVITGLDGIGKTQLALRYVQLYRQQYDNIVWINAECNATFKKSFTDLAEKLKINLKNANGVENELPDNYVVVRALASLSTTYGALGEPEKQNTLVEKTLAKDEKCYKPDQYQVATTLLNLDNAYRSLGQSEKQETFLEKALVIDEKHYEPDQYQVAITLTNLGNAVGALGQPDKQKILLEKALVIQEKHYGPDHHEVATILVNLGSAYGALGQPEKQKILLEKALVIQEKHYGHYHYEVATILVNLGRTYGALGQPEKQKTLLEKALMIQEKHYGPKHYQVATTLVYLGNAYGALGQLEKQKTFLEKALVIDKKYYGPNHYQVAITLVNLGNAFGALGLPKKQKILLKKALMIQEKHYGSDHFEVAITLVNLGNAYGALGQLEKQKNLFEKALVIQEKHYGPDHYVIATILVNLSRAYGALGQPEKQKTLLEKALVIDEKHYGPNHYQVAITLVNLSDAFGALGQPEKQKTLLEKALMVQEKHYGPDHYEVAMTLANLGRAYGGLGHPEKQKTLLEKALLILEKQYGPNHSVVARALTTLSTAYGALGQSLKQKTLLEKALPILEKHYGPDHYEVAVTLGHLGNAYGALGQPEKQKTLLEKVLTILKNQYGLHHYVIARALASLSNAYGALGQPEEQKSLLKKALDIQNKHYGSDHYEVAITSAKLGNAYGALGQPEKQKTFLEKALLILEKHYGPDHYVVAQILIDKGQLNNVHDKVIINGLHTQHQNVEWLNLMQNSFISNNVAPNVHINSPPNPSHLLPLVESFDANAQLLSEYTPRNVHYEIQLSNISVVKEIGDGNYGIVVKGILHNHRGLSGNIAVALKTLKCGNRLEETCLSNELNILLRIGQHCNIISMIGAITKPCHLGSFILVNEFCELGDLENFIKQRKPLYENGYENLSPIDELNSVLNGSYLCFSALLMYALQIANGAYYYTQIKTVIHRDLALRNILLTSDHVVKIADFGLSVKAASYVVMNPKPCPIPWYAPESLRDTNAVFTAESDVWSYGVILWELFSLAGNVWGVQAPKKKKKLLEWISLGNRYEIPKYASQPIAQLMKECWQFLPENRPNFLQCRTETQKILFTDNFEVFNYISQKIDLEIL